jgi:hypothetical protein
MRRRTRAAVLRAASPMTMRAPMSWSVEAIRDLVGWFIITVTYWAER